MNYVLMILLRMIVGWTLLCAEPPPVPPVVVEPAETPTESPAEPATAKLETLCVCV